MKTTMFVASAALALLAGCASAPMGTSYVPVVDLQGKDQAKYSQDLAECQGLARQRDNAAQMAVAGAIAGALLGAVLAPREYRHSLVNRGALIGAAGGAGNAVETQQDIIKRCLAGRGYSVLN